MKHLIRRLETRLRGSKQRLDILALAHNAMMLGHLQPLIDRFEAEGTARIWYCDTYQRLLSPPPVHFADKPRTRVVPYGIAAKMRWDAILYPEHDKYFREECPKFYIGHGVLGGKQSMKQYCYDFNPGVRPVNGRGRYTRMFKSSRHICNLILAHEPAFADVLVPAGSMMADRLMATPRPARIDGARTRVLLLSSWGPHSLIGHDPAGFGKLVETLSHRHDVIIGAHPHWRRGDCERTGLKVDLPSLEGPHVRLHKNTDGSFGAFPEADFAVTDFSSAGAYFAMLERPMVLFDSPGMAITDISIIPDLRRHLPTTRRLADVPNCLEQAIHDFSAERAVALRTLLLDHPGEAVERHYHEIMDSLDVPQALEAAQ